MTCAYCKEITVCAICGKGYAEAGREKLLADALEALSQACSDASSLGHPLSGFSERRAARESQAEAEAAIRALPTGVGIPLEDQK